MTQSLPTTTSPADAEVKAEELLPLGFVPSTFRLAGPAVVACKQMHDSVILLRIVATPITVISLSWGSGAGRTLLAFLEIVGAFHSVGYRREPILLGFVPDEPYVLAGDQLEEFLTVLGDAGEMGETQNPGVFYGDGAPS